MRRHLLSIFAVIFLVALITVFAIKMRHQGPLDVWSKHQDFDQLIGSFRSSHSPKAELNLSRLYGGGDHFKILHPQFAFNPSPYTGSLATCSPASLSGIFKYRPSSQCELAPMQESLRIERVKEREFMSIIQGAQLSAEQFIVKSPFINYSGASYAYLLSRQNIFPFNDRNWIERHLAFFRTTELAEILNTYQIYDPRFQTLSELTEQETSDLVEGKSLVIGKNLVLVKNQLQLGFSPLSYWAYEINDLRAYLKNTEYDLVKYSGDVYCLERVGNACWTYSSKTAMSYVHRYAMVIVLFVGAFVLLLVGSYSRYVIYKEREERKHRTSLQVLSHEFRTPVTTLLLINEQLNRNLSRYPESDQDLLMKASAEIYRLQRIIEMSKQYLHSTCDEKRFNIVRIPSLNAWIKDFTEDFDSRIKCELLTIDIGIKADLFWLRFALTNLLQNAFAHGMEPVYVRLSEDRGRIEIAVEDQGVCEFTSLGKMSEPFSKSARSQGMGLGLNITSSIVRELGGTLKYKQAPTTFALAMRVDHMGSNA